MIFAAIFSIVVGLLMIGQWAFFYFSGNIPELKTEPRRIGFHLVGEFLTAVLLIAGGILLFANVLTGFPLTLIALGMLLYTVVVSPGYFAQRDEWALVIMFAVLFVLALVSVVLLVNAMNIVYPGIS